MKPADQLPTRLAPTARARYARAACVIDLEAVALAFEAGACECREFAEAAPAWDPATLRRKLHAIVLSTIAAVVDAETASETIGESGTYPAGRP